MNHRSPALISSSPLWLALTHEISDHHALRPHGVLCVDMFMIPCAWSDAHAGRAVSAAAGPALGGGGALPPYE